MEIFEFLEFFRTCRKYQYDGVRASCMFDGVRMGKLLGAYA